MKSSVLIDKPEGMTPLEAVESFRKKYPEYLGVKIGYAGRLDPMASGALLLLVGEENKKIEKYMRLDKEYLAEFLLDIETDTHDILGIPKNSESEHLKFIKKGKQIQQIPIFSSYRVKGKPLFWYALNKKSVKIPLRVINIKSIKIIHTSQISSRKLLEKIIFRISKIRGNFRQNQIKEKWKTLLGNNSKKFRLVTLKIACSSGTYIRAIASKIKACVFSLRRTKIGKFRVEKAIKLKN